MIELIVYKCEGSTAHMEISNDNEDIQLMTAFCDSCRRLIPRILSKSDIIDFHLPPNAQQDTCTLCQFFCIVSPALFRKPLRWLRSRYRRHAGKYQLALDNVLGLEHEHCTTECIRRIKDRGNHGKPLHILSDQAISKLNTIQLIIDLEKIRVRMGHRMLRPTRIAMLWKDCGTGTPTYENDRLYKALGRTSHSRRKLRYAKLCVGRVRRCCQFNWKFIPGTSRWAPSYDQWRHNCLPSTRLSLPLGR